MDKFCLIPPQKVKLALILKLTLIATIFFLIINKPLSAKPIISGISSNEVNIDTNFNGTKILLFGARKDSGNIVIAVRGPKKNFFVTKKQKLMGVWYNGKRIKFNDFPTYYSLFSTFGSSNIENNLLSELELGINNLQTSSENNDEIDLDDFKLQLINRLENDKLYSNGSNPVDFLDENLFKVTIDFPKNISKGVYTVEIYLINDDNLISFQSIPIYVNQVGLSAEISNYAHNQSLLYGLFAVIIALLIGWITNYLFGKFINK